MNFCRPRGVGSRMVFVQLLLAMAAAPRVSGWSTLSIRSSSATTMRLSLASTPSLSEQLDPKQEEKEDSSLPRPNRKRLGRASFLYQQKIQHEQETLHPQRDRRNARSTQATASRDDLRKLAEEHSRKRVGSLKYKRAWTDWLYKAVESIRQDLGRELLRSSSFDDNDDNNENTYIDRELRIREAFEGLFFDLGVAADEGTMPSFDNEDARKGYALEFFCRGRSLAEFLLDTPVLEKEEETTTTTSSSSAKGHNDPEFWSRALRSPDCPLLGATTAVEPSSNYEIVSLGGGPGFDFVGIALATAFSFHTTNTGTTSSASSRGEIRVTAMDYQEGWSDLVHAMNRSTRKLLNLPSSADDDGIDNDGDDSAVPSLPRMSCEWGGKCDITKSILHDPVNANCKRFLFGGTKKGQDLGNIPPTSAARLWICQYCVAENARALRASDYVFFKELVREMPTGTLLLLTEVAPRVWPELVRMLHREGLLSGVDVDFGGRRESLGGKQFLLRKREVSAECHHPTNHSSTDAVTEEEHRDAAFASLDDRTRERLEHFERLASYHERKKPNRQGRKANGSVYHEEQLRRRQKMGG